MLGSLIAIFDSRKRDLAIKAILYVVVAGMVSVIGWGIYDAIWDRGYEAKAAEVAEEISRKNKELRQSGLLISQQATELQAAEVQAKVLNDEIENAARADPDALRRRPSDASLRRVRERWGARP